MIKITGAILILAITTWCGFEFSRSYSNRTRQLRHFRNSLQALEAEIMYGHVPLSEAAGRLSKQMPKPVGQFWGDFAAQLEKQDATAKIAWEESLKAIGPLLALRKGELEILAHFGETLGRHDRFQQQKQIILAMTHLEREEEEAVQSQMKYEKMVKSLGFLSGLLLIILLL